MEWIAIRPEGKKGGRNIIPQTKISLAKAARVIMTPRMSIKSMSSNPLGVMKYKYFMLIAKSMQILSKN
jgi:hypothetical protein